MRRLPIAVLPLILVVAACSSDTTTSTPFETTTTAEAPTMTTIAAVEVSGSTGIPVESDDGFDVFENGASSDDRLVGVYTLQVECDIAEDGETTIADCSGPNTLTTDAGTWAGTCEGTSTWTTTEPEHAHVMDCTYLGGGAYAGLRFIQHLEGTSYPWAYTGRIEPVG